jgi:hypothetical protein
MRDETAVQPVLDRFPKAYIGVHVRSGEGSVPVETSISILHASLGGTPLVQMLIFKLYHSLT